ncbi:MAG: ribonuclease P protein component [Ignavibacteriales bacterium]|nr:MAG: ribonuclease P protein component [Ignavibacteriales bacterium]
MKRFGLSKKERIRSRKDIQKIYSFGKTISSSTKKIKATYLSEPAQNEGSISIMTAIAKKSGNAVWRNRVKRLIRESYRQKKQTLVEACLKKNKRLNVVFSSNTINEEENKKISLKEIMPEVEELIATIGRSI